MTLLLGLVLGFLPVHGGVEGKVHQTPFKKGGGARRLRRVGAGQSRLGFLPTLETTPHTIRRLHQARHPPTCTNCLEVIYDVSP